MSFPSTHAEYPMQRKDATRLKLGCLVWTTFPRIFLMQEKFKQRDKKKMISDLQEYIYLWNANDARDAYYSDEKMWICGKRNVTISQLIQPCLYFSSSFS
eukprot:NODE_1472_length_1153_cov_58.634964_g1205_i0.p1 GENE.NODE_1472_length_1153_cov_58.634964_g1205_i0~~NODE_1472_length_1153_cov_58.634964_g1205_i0.p1  ORF type:complete len:100 (+),score=10.99 NODE_1472_length_1153_cov_58.634964_g1205_i0:121-420(+)